MKHDTQFMGEPLDAPTRKFSGRVRVAIGTVITINCAIFWTAVFAWFLA